jgi:hypothetical protein
MFRKQFLLSTKDMPPLNDFAKLKIGDYHLHYHNDLPFSHSKTEGNALDINKISPFNSRHLLNLLISVERSKRSVFNCKLYDRIIYYLSDNNTDVINMPINPQLDLKFIG